MIEPRYVRMELVDGLWVVSKTYLSASTAVSYMSRHEGHHFLVNAVARYAMRMESFEGRVIVSSADAEVWLYNPGGHARRCEWTAVAGPSTLRGYYVHAEIAEGTTRVAITTSL